VLRPMPKIKPISKRRELTLQPQHTLTRTLDAIIGFSKVRLLQQRVPRYRFLHGGDGR
jgi:hypothetical protein